MASADIEEKVIEFQKMEKQLEMYMGQRYQFEMQLAETAAAIEEITKLADSAEIYKSTGGFFVKTAKGPAIEELNSRKALLESRSKMFREQEEKLKANLTRLGKSLEEEMKGAK
jgi:prefoldin beta subunit